MTEGPAPTKKSKLRLSTERISKDAVELSWSTASEKNNKGFEIQRMLEHEQKWITLDWVEGAGTTDHSNFYLALDPNSYGGRSHYRLKQLGAADKETYSEVVTVEGAQAVRIVLFPNPVNAEIKLKFEQIAPSQLNLNIFNSLGQLVHHQAGIEVQTNDVLRIAEAEAFPQGTYFIQLQGQDFVYEEQFVKKAK